MLKNHFSTSNHFKGSLEINTFWNSVRARALLHIIPIAVSSFFVPLYGLITFSLHLALTNPWSFPVNDDWTVVTLLFTQWNHTHLLFICNQFYNTSLSNLRKEPLCHLLQIALLTQGTSQRPKGDCK